MHMTLAEYFESHRPKPRYAFGTRVEGTYQGIPYVGTVYTDNMRNLAEGPMCHIHLDLPLQTKKGQPWVNYIRVGYKSIKGIRQ
jgi:hypothetical protein